MNGLLYRGCWYVLVTASETTLPGLPTPGIYRMASAEQASILDQWAVHTAHTNYVIATLNLD